MYDVVLCAKLHDTHSFCRVCWDTRVRAWVAMSTPLQTSTGGDVAVLIDRSAEPPSIAVFCSVPECWTPAGLNIDLTAGSSDFFPTLWDMNWQIVNRACKSVPRVGRLNDARDEELMRLNHKSNRWSYHESTHGVLQMIFQKISAFGFIDPQKLRGSSCQWIWNRWRW